MRARRRPIVGLITAGVLAMAVAGCGSSSEDTPVADGEPVVMETIVPMLPTENPFPGEVVETAVAEPIATYRPGLDPVGAEVPGNPEDGLPVNVVETRDPILFPDEEQDFAVAEPSVPSAIPDATADPNLYPDRFPAPGSDEPGSLNSAPNAPELEPEPEPVVAPTVTPQEVEDVGPPPLPDNVRPSYGPTVMPTPTLIIAPPPANLEEFPNYVEPIVINMDEIAKAYGDNNTPPPNLRIAVSQTIVLLTISPDRWKFRDQSPADIVMTYGGVGDKTPGLIGQKAGTTVVTIDNPSLGVTGIPLTVTVE